MDLLVVAARTSKGGVRAGVAVNVVAGMFFSVVAASSGWLRRHKRWSLRWALVVAGLRLLQGWGVVAGGGWLVAVLVAVFPALVVGVWSTRWPFTYERRCAGPLRRLMWRRWVRKNWRDVSRAVGLSACSQSKRRVWSWGDKRDKGFGLSQSQNVTRWADSRLCSATTADQVLVLLVRARRGSKAGEVIAKAEEIAADVPGAHSARTRKISPSTAELRLVMGDVLEGIRDSADPATAEVRNAAAGSAGVGVVIGRAEDGTPVVVDLVADASHSALQGQTRSGKSALSYGILGSYAHRPEVLVCGVDPSGILLGPFTTGRGGAWIATGTADLAQAVAALAGVVAEMDARIATLADCGLDKIETFTPGAAGAAGSVGGIPRPDRRSQGRGRRPRPQRRRTGRTADRAFGRSVVQGVRQGRRPGDDPCPADVLQRGRYRRPVQLRPPGHAAGGQRRRGQDAARRRGQVPGR